MNLPVPLGFFSGTPGVGELIVVFGVILILFGPRRLPEIARMIGRTLSELRKASHDFRDQVMQIDAEDSVSYPLSPDSKPAAFADTETEGDGSSEDLIFRRTPRDQGEDEEPKNDLAG